MDSGLYIVKFKVVQNKGLVLLRNHIINLLKQAYKDSLDESSKDEKQRQGTESLLIPINIQLKYVAPRLKPLCSEIEVWSERSEYFNLLADVQYQFFLIRRSVMTDIVRNKLLQFSQEKDISVILRNSLHYLMSTFETEFDLFSLIFSKPADAFYSFVLDLSFPLYNYIRPIIVRCSSIAQLCEIIAILYKEITTEIVSSGREEKLSELLLFIKRIIEDTQERLIFVSDDYLHDQVVGFEPSANDLDYPNILLKPNEGEKLWYPTLDRTVTFLSRLYVSIQPESFNGIAQLALTYCIQSLCLASDMIHKKSIIDGDLFLIRYLSYLQDQISAFEIDFFTQDNTLDFSYTQDLLRKLMKGDIHFKSVFSLSTNNALFAIIQSAVSPRLKYSKTDLRKNMEALLSQTMELFIYRVTQNVVDTLIEFVSSANSFFKANNVERLKVSIEDTHKSLYDQEFATPQRVVALVKSFRINFDDYIPIMVKKLRLYLKDNKNEEVLLKSIKFNIGEAVKNLNKLVEAEYKPEDIKQMELISLEYVDEKFKGEES